MPVAGSGYVTDFLIFKVHTHIKGKPAIRKGTPAAGMDPHAQPGALRSRPIREREILRGRLRALREWQEEGWRLIEAITGYQGSHTGSLFSGGSGGSSLPSSSGFGSGSGLPGLFSGGSEEERREALKRLMFAMSQNSLSIFRLESGWRQWHLALKAAKEAIYIRTDLATVLLGQPLRQDARAYLMRAQATFMLEGNSPKLRRDLRDALELIPGSKGLAYWLARFELMVGHRQEAWAAFQRAPDYPRMRVIRALLQGRATGSTSASRYSDDPTEGGEGPGTPTVPTYEGSTSTSDVVTNPPKTYSGDTGSAPDFSAADSFPYHYYSYRYTLISDEVVGNISTYLDEKASTVEEQAAKENALLAKQGLRCFLPWNQVIAYMEQQSYSDAVAASDECQRAILAYLLTRYPDLQSSATTSDTSQGVYDQLVALAEKLTDYSKAKASHTVFRTRYQAESLSELYDLDWMEPKVSADSYLFYTTDDGFFNALQDGADYKVQEKIDAPLLAIATIFVPLTLIDGALLRLDFATAEYWATQLEALHSSTSMLCQLIEVPFVKILKARALLAEADAQYKARSKSPDPALNPDGSYKYQGLLAADTYEQVLSTFRCSGYSEYVDLVTQGATSLEQQIRDFVEQLTFSPIAASEGASEPLWSSSDRIAFDILTKGVPLDVVSTSEEAINGAMRYMSPYDFLVQFVDSSDSTEVPPSTDPLIFALLSEAQQKLFQMEAGLNYLGYRDDYVPPWRFQFLLSRARYFAEHAKNAESEYLTFLANAEREEFQEMSVSQNVILEKASVRIETARVEQSQLELEASKQGLELAQLTAANAQTRVEEYKDFNRTVSSQEASILSRSEDMALLSSSVGLVSGVITAATTGNPMGLVNAGVSAFNSYQQVKQQETQMAIAAEQRGLEYSTGFSP